MLCRMMHGRAAISHLQEVLVDLLLLRLVGHTGASFVGVLLQRNLAISCSQAGLGMLA